MSYIIHTMIQLFSSSQLSYTFLSRSLSINFFTKNNSNSSSRVSQILKQCSPNFQHGTRAGTIPFWLSLASPPSPAVAVCRCSDHHFFRRIQCWVRLEERDSALQVAWLDSQQRTSTQEPSPLEVHPPRNLQSWCLSIDYVCETHSSRDENTLSCSHLLWSI